MEPRVVVGDHKNQGKAAVLFGPLVLCADQALLESPEGSMPALSLKTVALPGSTVAALDLVPEPAPVPENSWPGARVFRINAVTRTSAGSLAAGAPVKVR